MPTKWLNLGENLPRIIHITQIFHLSRKNKHNKATPPSTIAMLHSGLRHDRESFKAFHNFCKTDPLH